MRSQPLVTVCIPTFNRRSLLAASLGSVLAQPFDDVEIIVSDNASTDDTEEYVRSIDDPRLTYDRLDENIGLFGNLTRALQLGGGRYRVVLPDDDLMLPGNLEAKTAFLEAHPDAGLVHSAFRYLDEDSRPYGKTEHWTLLEGDTLEKGADFIRRSISLGGIVCVSSVMLRSDVVAGETFNADDGPYADIALWLRVASRSDVGFLAKALSGYRVHNGSQSSSSYSLMQVRGGKARMSLHAADVTYQAHSRFVQNADLTDQERAELTALLQEADRRMRLRVRANAYVPPVVLSTLKRLVRRVSAIDSHLTMRGNLSQALQDQPLQAEPLNLDEPLPGDHA